jgi:hypothetical protein
MNAEQSYASKTLSVPVLILGICVMLGSALLAGRLIWEMTLLTWERGPQMIGFSLAHGAGALLFFAPVCLLLWILACLCTAIAWKIRKKNVQRETWIALGAAALVLMILLIPSNFWDRIFIGKLTSSSHSAEFLIRAAGSGEQGIVKALLERGISPNATDRQGNTALHSAAAMGRTEIVVLLMDKGADANALNLYGDSPLERASANHQQQVIQILSSKGAKDIRGDEAQRQRASQEIVRRDIEEMNSQK